MRYFRIIQSRIREAARNVRIFFSPAFPFSDEKIIWIKTPKCGGTSVKNELEDAGYLYMGKPGKRVITGIYSAEIGRFKKKYPEFWQQAWKFAIVRNPYDKFVSGWKYLRRTKRKPLSEVLESPPKKDSNFHDWLHLSRTQIEVFMDENEKFILDKVIHFENLEIELNEVLKENNLPEIKLPQHNITSDRKKKYAQYFDENSKKLLEARYKKDLEFFKYKFGD